MIEKIFKLFAVIIFCFTLAGCAWRYILPEQKWEIERLEAKKMKKHYEVNLSKTSKNGKLIIYVLPPSMQMMVENYEIMIDDHDIIEVFKYSKVEIILDEGTHFVTAGVKGFGRNATQKVVIKDGGSIILTYTGPYWVWEAGNFKKGQINIPK